MGNLLNKSLICLAIIYILLCGFAHARNRSETYIDDNGAKRVVKTGKIYRDYKAVQEFKRLNPKPDDSSSYDIEHIIPLRDGGADEPSNMRWVPTDEHRKNNPGRPPK